MNNTEQGVQQQSRLPYCLFHLLALITICLCQTIYADTSSKKTDQPNTNGHQHHNISLMYSTDSTLQSGIAQKIRHTFAHSDKSIHISEITSLDTTNISDIKSELVIAIGINNIQSANKYFSNTGKLLIASNPGEHRPTKKPEVNNTVLYMSQPYCRQIHFINQINSQWRTFSYLSSQNNPADDDALQQCAKKYDLATYKVATSEEDQLTNNIKKALSHSDLILALPDKTIYNRKSVKNILLTSYRYRKPVIAFSQNFVNAGALASIQSNTEQIAHSAAKLIEQFFDSDKQFRNSINYPYDFDISINRQVFRALDLSVPDIDKLKQTLEYHETGKSGELL